jgi:hypothetical protein
MDDEPTRPNDSQSLRTRTTRSRSFKVDTSFPESVVTMTGTMGPYGWFLGSATASLSASDAVAGVERIEIYGCGPYGMPIVFSANGPHDGTRRGEPVESALFILASSAPDTAQGLIPRRTSGQ